MSVLTAPLDDTEAPCLRDTCVWKAYAVAISVDASISLILDSLTSKCHSRSPSQEKVKGQRGGGPRVPHSTETISRSTGLIVKKQCSTSSNACSCKMPCRSSSSPRRPDASEKGIRSFIVSPEEVGLVAGQPQKLLAKVIAKKNAMKPAERPRRSVHRAKIASQNGPAKLKP